MFSKHHYLSGEHNNVAKVFILTLNDIVAGFLSVLHFPHATVKNIKKIHRLVILPEFQGLSIGIKFLDEVSSIFIKEGNRILITTSNPALIGGLAKRTYWKLKRYGRVSKSGGSNLNLR